MDRRLSEDDVLEGAIPVMPGNLLGSVEAVRQSFPYPQAIDYPWFSLRDMGSMALDVVPVVGDVKSAQEAVSGRDLVTGEKLPWWARGLAGIGALPGVPNLAPLAGLMLGAKAAGAVGKMKVGGKSVARREVAERLKGMGADDEVIWRKTGWRSDPRGNWAFEVDDSKMSFLIDNKRLQSFGPDDVMPLDKVIKHDELFAQYPQLRGVKVEVGYGTGASYSEVSNTITIGDAHFRGGYKGRTVKEDMIHEIQHAIQDIEGWPRGGTPKPSYNPVWDDKRGWTHPSREQAWQEYMDLWGEFQSRDAASRATWGPGERKLVRPYSSEFEPSGGWIFR